MKDQLWRSLEDLEKDFREFPEGATFWNDPLSRRHFLKIMGASLALAGLNGCTWFTPDDVVPYVEAPEDVIPGQPLFYATSHLLGGFAKGILAETHMARPTKIEGNPKHPATLGGSDVFMQAAILQLYSPERGKTPLHRGSTASWDQFQAHLAINQFPRWKKTSGQGLRILTDTLTSPTLSSLIMEFLSRYPQARWHQYDPVNRDAILEGARLAFGKPLNPIYRLNQARIILSLGADFMGWGPGDLRYAREFTDQRRLRADRPAEMNRLYVAETDFSITGASADHRLAVRPTRIEALARALAGNLGLANEAPASPLLPAEERWLSATARDLSANPGKSLVIVGDDQPAIVHALGHWINQTLAAPGVTVDYIPSVEANSEGQLRSITRLAQDIQSGTVESLLIFGSNPVFTAPADLGFRELLQKVPERYCFDENETETSFYCDWYLPKAHDLESWGDARAFDGTVSLQQPVVAPLYHGKAPIELISAFLERPGALGRDILKNYWQLNWKPQPTPSTQSEPFEIFWERALHDGFIRDTAFKALPARISRNLASVFSQKSPSEGSEANALELSFKPDPRIWDGRYLSNAWLQELPKPLTQLTWDNAAILSPGTAKNLQVKSEDLIRLELEGRAMEAPVFILPGHADDAITIHLGYGSERERRGFDAYRLRTTDRFWFSRGLKVTKTGSRYPLASSQTHQVMEGRDLVPLGTLARYRMKARKLESHKPLPSLYHEFVYNDEAWAMVIDLTVCIGCKACTIACQAENNIPVVGKNEVINRREMHWIRVDRYFHGSPDAPTIAFQPVPCMHCEKAPCEYVCPTEATVHDTTGLNQMIYNRCIGTRDCSNNCPYKVRRFNFLQYSEYEDPVKRLLYNPNVTVREYGVMEKCTYCIQRINRARIEAAKQNRKIKTGEVVTACQSACPTRAILFGNRNNPDEEVTRLKKHPLNYGLLEELGTQPRTTYLARVTNPNPELEPS